MSSPTMCCACGKDEAGEIWSSRKQDWLCLSCYREYHPPRMTLMSFDRGSYRKLWNLEVGRYEEFENVEDIEWCGWIVRCEQETLYSKMPEVRATVYHMEYHGDFVCGRCVDYKFFDGNETCMAAACQKVAKPHRPEKEIQRAPVQSRFSKWIAEMYHHD